MLPQIQPSTTLLEFYRQLITTTPIIDGKLVECRFAIADGTSKSFPHGLGRPWRGAFIVGGTAGSGVQCTTNIPDSALASPTEVQVLLSAAADALVRLWVY